MNPIEACRREQRVLARVCRAAWRLEQAEQERVHALVSARAEGISIRKLAAAAGPSPSRVHQLVADTDLDALDAALGELRAAGWPAAPSATTRAYPPWTREDTAPHAGHRACGARQHARITTASPVSSTRSTRSTHSPRRCGNSTNSSSSPCPETSRT